MLAHIHPCRHRFAYRARPCFGGRLSLALCPGTTPGPPSAQSPFARLGCYLRRDGLPGPPRRALPLLLRSYGLMRQTKSLPSPTVTALVDGSSQVAASPCWKMALPDVISANPSPGAWALTPAVPVVHLPVSSHRTTAFPTLQPGRLPATSHTATSVWTLFRGCSHSITFRPPGLLATQVAPTAVALCHRAAVASTSEQNTGRYLPVHRICLPSESGN